MTSEEKKSRQTATDKDLPETEEDLKPEQECEESGEAEKAEEAETQAQTAKESEEEALNTKYMRLMADFQNFKRRTEKEKSDIYAFANEKIVKELLDVIDNFERALAAGNDGDKSQGQPPQGGPSGNGGSEA